MKKRQWKLILNTSAFMKRNYILLNISYKIINYKSS